MQDLDLFISVVKAQNNKILGTCVAGGVELHGLHATVAPRRQQVQALPLVERYDFVPYTEDDIAASKDPALCHYVRLVERFVRQQLKSSVVDSGTTNGLKNRELITKILKESPVTGEVVSEDELKQLQGQSKFLMINVLKKIFDVEHDEFYLKNMEDLMLLERDNLQSDVAYSFIRNEHCLKTCLDVVIENCSMESGKLRVVECNAEEGFVFKNATSYLSTQPGLHFDYTVVCSDSDVLDRELVENLCLQPVIWKISSGSPPPSQLIGADLVILGDVLHKQRNILETLSFVANLVHDKGFLLVIEPTANLIVPLSFFALSNDLSYISDQKERCFGPFCTQEKWREHLSASGLKIVAQKSDGLLHTIYLCRKKSAAEVNLSNQTTIDVDGESYTWVEGIKEALIAHEKSSSVCGQNIWLKAKELHSGIIGLANCLSREPGGEKIR